MHSRRTTRRARGTSEPLDLPTAVVESLHHFDGRPVAEVLAEIQEQKGVTVDAELVSLLLDFEILKPRRG
jgi:hypothetical protein